MFSGLRDSGIGLIGKVNWGTHLCQFYDTKEDLLEILVPYFKAGLEGNELCVWVTSEPLGVEDALRAMRGAVKGFDDYLKKGQIEVLTYTDWYVREKGFEHKRVLNSWLNKLKEAEQRGYEGIRATGNTYWVEKKDWARFTEYEREVERTIGSHKMIALCTYATGKCGAAELLDIVSTHQAALIKRDGRWRFIDSECKAVSAALIKSLPGIFYFLDPNGRILRWNRNLELSTGYSAGEIASMSPQDFFSVETRGYITARMYETIEKGRATAEAELLSKDGTRTPYYFTGVSTEIDGVKYIVGVGFDVTNWKKA